MNADPAAQSRLLDLQAVDTALAQLTHRRRTLPELERIARCEERLGTVRDELVRIETDATDLDREQRRLELDVDQVRQRAQRDRKRLDAGAVGSPKELESLQHEIESLARRQSELEDQVLELMERREETEQRLVAARSEVEEITAERDAATAVRDKTWAEIDAEIGMRTTARASLADGIPADLLALYQRIRDQSGGVGAAALKQRRCEGCRLEVSPSELSRARTAAPDEVLRCEECSRILVRTAESGL